MSQPADQDKVRLDRWLWAARFFKTRAQAKAAIEGGKVHFHSPGPSARATRPKVSKEVSVGDTLTVRRGETPETLVITGLADKRGNAKQAATLYTETAASIEAREAHRASARLQRLGLQVPATRPSKHSRRALRKLKQES